MDVRGATRILLAPLILPATPHSNKFDCISKHGGVATSPRFMSRQSSSHVISNVSVLFPRRCCHSFGQFCNLPILTGAWMMPGCSSAFWYLMRATLAARSCGAAHLNTHRIRLLLLSRDALSITVTKNGETGKYHGGKNLKIVLGHPTDHMACRRGY